MMMMVMVMIMMMREGEREGNVHFSVFVPSETVQNTILETTKTRLFGLNSKAFLNLQPFSRHFCLLLK